MIDASSSPIASLLGHSKQASSAPLIVRDLHFDYSSRRRSSRHACMLEITRDLDGIQYRGNDFQISTARGTS